MALVTRAADTSPDGTTGQITAHIPDLVCGEDIDIAAPCYIKASDGLVYMSNGTAANAAAACNGFSMRAAKAGQPISLYGPGQRFRNASSGLTPGAKLYIGATKGRLDTAATTGDAVGVAFAMSATDIVVSRYA